MKEQPSSKERPRSNKQVQWTDALHEVKTTEESQEKPVQEVRKDPVTAADRRYSVDASIIKKKRRSSSRSPSLLKKTFHQMMGDPRMRRLKDVKIPEMTKEQLTLFGMIVEEAVHELQGTFNDFFRAMFKKSKNMALKQNNYNAAPMVENYFASQRIVETRERIIEDKRSKSLTDATLRTEHFMNIAQLQRDDPTQIKRCKEEKLSNIDEYLEKYQDDQLGLKRDREILDIDQTKATVQSLFMQGLVQQLQHDRPFKELTHKLTDKILAKVSSEAYAPPKDEELKKSIQMSAGTSRLMTQLKKMKAAVVGSNDAANLQRYNIEKTEERVYQLLRSDPADVIEKLMEQEALVLNQRKTFFEEIMKYRQQSYSRTINKNLHLNDSQMIKIEYFDETEGLDPDIKKMMTIRIDEVKEQFQSIIKENIESNAGKLRKLDKFEKLPIDRKFLAKMPSLEVLQAMAILETDPFKVWDLLEQAYRPLFLEEVIFKKYAYLFNENAEVNLHQKMMQVKEESFAELIKIKTQYDESFLKEREECEFWREKASELEQEVSTNKIEALRTADEKAKNHYTEKLILLENKHKKALEAQMEQLRELKYEISQKDVQIDRQRIKFFAFKWIVNHKLQALKFLPKDSQKYYDSYARLEIAFKNQLDEAVNHAISSTKDTLDSMTYLAAEQAEQIHDLNYNILQAKMREKALTVTIESKDEAIMFLTRSLNNTKLSHQEEITKAQQTYNENKVLKQTISDMQDRIAELKQRYAEYGVNPPNCKLDYKLLSTKNSKQMEQNHVLAQLQEAIAHAVKDTLRRVGRRETTTSKTQTEKFRDVRQRIVYDYNYGKNAVNSSGTETNYFELMGDHILERAMQTDLGIKNVIAKNTELDWYIKDANEDLVTALKVDHQLFKRTFPAKLEALDKEHQEAIGQLTAQLKAGRDTSETKKPAKGKKSAWAKLRAKKGELKKTVSSPPKKEKDTSMGKNEKPVKESSKTVKTTEMRKTESNTTAKDSSTKAKVALKRRKTMAGSALQSQTTLLAKASNVSGKSGQKQLSVGRRTARQSPSGSQPTSAARSSRSDSFASSHSSNANMSRVVRLPVEEVNHTQEETVMSDAQERQTNITIDNTLIDITEERYGDNSVQANKKKKLQRRPTIVRNRTPEKSTISDEQLEMSAEELVKESLPNMFQVRKVSVTHERKDKNTNSLSPDNNSVGRQRQGNKKGSPVPRQDQSNILLSLMPKEMALPKEWENQESVFNRLWNKQLITDSTKEVQKADTTQKQSAQWVEKLAANNTLVKQVEGMPIYTDKRTGKAFIHMGDLRQRLNNRADSPPRDSLKDKDTIGSRKRSGKKQRSLSPPANMLAGGSTLKVINQNSIFDDRSKLHSQQQLSSSGRTSTKCRSIRQSISSQLNPRPRLQHASIGDNQSIMHQSISVGEQTLTQFPHLKMNYAPFEMYGDSYRSNEQLPLRADTRNRKNLQALKRHTGTETRSYKSSSVVAQPVMRPESAITVTTASRQGGRETRFSQMRKTMTYQDPFKLQQFGASAAAFNMGAQKVLDEQDKARIANQNILIN